MTKVVILRGFMFSTSLTDGTTLCMQAGESKIIKDNLVSDSLRSAYKQGIVDLISIETKSSTTKEKIGGAK